jgi:Xaa-Pro aminopeptidase
VSQAEKVQGVPPAEIEARLEGLTRTLREQEIDFVLVFQNVDRFYYSGTMQDGVLLVHRDGHRALFVRRTVERARRESPLQRVEQFGSFRHIGEYVADNGLSAGTIGLELDVLPAALHLRLARLFPEARFTDVAGAVRTQRSVKSGYEQDLVREAGRRFDRVLQAMRSEIQPGRTEYQVYQHFIRLLAQEKSALVVRTRSFNMEAEQRFLLSGTNAADLSVMDSPTAAGQGLSPAYPWGAGDRKIRPGEPFLIDSVFIFQGYMVDCTRIYASGTLDPKLTRAHGVSGDCHRMFLDSVARGDPIEQVYWNVSAYVDLQGLSPWFMGGVKFIGHGVGMELDEFPVITEKFPGGFANGMVVAFEPKFVFPEGTMGYENTYLIDEDRAVSLDNIDTGILYTG